MMEDGELVSGFVRFMRYPDESCVSYPKASAFRYFSMLSIRCTVRSQL